MKGFLDLPPELARNLASSLGREDMKSLRLTCRQTNGHFFDCWVEAHYEEIYILPTLYSLNRLHDVLKNDKIRCAVRRIAIFSTIHTMQFLWHHWFAARRAQYKITPVELEEESSKNVGSSWERAVKYRKFLLSEDFGAMLGRALHAFSGTEISVLREPSKCKDNITILGWLEMIRESECDIVSSYPTLSNWPDASTSDQTIICCKILDVCSRLSITKLTLEGFDSCQIKAFNMTQMSIAQCFAHLALLCIEFHYSDNYGSLCKFLNALTNLQHFDVSITGAEDRPILLFHEVAISSLVTLKLNSYYALSVSDLTDLSGFLSHSVQTLRRVNIDGFEDHLDEARFREERREWAKFSRQLRDEFSRDSLFISGAFESQMPVVDIFGPGPESKHQQSRDIVRTQLDECIKHLESTVLEGPSGE